MRLGYDLGYDSPSEWTEVYSDSSMCSAASPYWSPNNSDTTEVFDIYELQIKRFTGAREN